MLRLAPAAEGNERGHGWRHYLSAFCLSREPFYWLWVSGSSPDYPPGGQTQDEPTQEILKAALLDTSRQGTPSWLCHKVETQPTSPSLDLPGVSRLPSLFTPRPWWSRSPPPTRYLSEFFPAMPFSLDPLSFNLYFPEASWGERHRTQSESPLCGGMPQSCLTLNLWTVACQAPLSMGFPRQEYCSGLPFSSSRGSSRPRDRTCISCVSCNAGRFFPCWVIREAHKWGRVIVITFYC